MNILLVNGGSRVGYLIQLLQEKGHRLTVIEPDQVCGQMLADRYEVVVVCGDGSKQSILSEAHVQDMDIVIALSEKDPFNLVVCKLAKNQFHVKHTYAMANNPQNASLFLQSGVDKCINPTRHVFDLVERDSWKYQLQSRLPSVAAQPVLSEITLDDKSPALQKKLWELGFPSQSLVVSILRGEDIIIPQGNTLFQTGDKVLIVSTQSSLEEASSLLRGPSRCN